jgi:hypothetical protein
MVVHILYYRPICVTVSFDEVGMLIFSSCKVPDQLSFNYFWMILVWWRLISQRLSLWRIGRRSDFILKVERAAGLSCSFLQLILSLGPVTLLFSNLPVVRVLYFIFVSRRTGRLSVWASLWVPRTSLRVYFLLGVLWFGWGCAPFQWSFHTTYRMNYALRTNP